MKKGQLIGIYGGTFDPIHFGHLNLAIQLAEIHKLDEIWFCPVQINPHKAHQKSTPFKNRFEMLELALKDVPKCIITDIESKLPSPSYTIDTLNALQAEEMGKSHPRQFCLLMGDDAIPGFFKWHRPEEIVKRVKIFIGRRSPLPVDLDSFTGNDEISKALREGLTETRLVEISGTEIRERLRAGEYCGHLVPEKVLDYICKNRLY